MIAWLTVFIAALLLIGSALPFVPLAHGIVRVLDFPHLQILSIAVVVLIVAVAVLPLQGLTWFVVLMLVLTIAIQSAYIARFSQFWPHSVAGIGEQIDSTASIRLLVCNVKQSNTDHASLRRLITKHQPDLAVFMETDQRWIDALKDAVSNYPEQMACPLDNAYGLFLVSRLPFASSQTRFLLNEEVPSFDVIVEVENFGPVRLIALHPEPPVPLRDTVGRDAEILLVGKMVREETRPVIVTGDLNDVAWSATTRRFLRISQLLDPREGRGLYNTFDARYFFLRWPLDHVFLSPRFKIVSIRRLPDVGSDHFPMLYDLALDEEPPTQAELPSADRTDLEEANELITEARQQDRRPVGTDWEKPED